jgi:hypothetical protein
MQTLTLLDYLNRFRYISTTELEAVRNYEQTLEQQGKDKELKEKIRLFQEIEGIVKDARTKSEIEVDVTKSKTNRLSGIKENQRQERELERQTLTNSDMGQLIHEMGDEDKEREWSKDENLTLFQKIQQQAWGEHHE